MRGRRLIVGILALVTIFVGHLFVYLLHRARVAGVGNYDAAWYYAVARNFALGRGLTDDIVWQYLALPKTVMRAAGEYWCPGWPLVLGLFMRVFGASQNVALDIAGALSFGLPLLAFWIGTMLRPVADSERPNLLAGWLAGLLVAVQPRIHQTTVLTDVGMPYALVCIGAIGLFLRAQRRWDRRLLFGAGVALALPLSLRGEGLVPLLAVVPSLLWSGRATRRERLSRCAAVLSGFLIGCMPLGIYNEIHFGRLGTLARARSLWLRDYKQLYLLNSDVSFQTWWRQGLWPLLDVRLRGLTHHALHAAMTLPLPLWVAAILGIHIGIRRRDPLLWPILSFVLITWVMPVMVAPIVAASARMTTHVAPFLSVLAGAGIAGLARAVAAWAERRWGTARKAQVLAAAVGAVFMAGAISWYSPFFFSLRSRFDYLEAFHALPAYATAPELLSAAGLSPRDVVVSEEAWQTAALFDVAAIYPPLDGPQALEQIVATYKPKAMFVRRDSRLEKALHASRLHCRERSGVADMMLCVIEP